MPRYHYKWEEKKRTKEKNVENNWKHWQLPTILLYGTTNWVVNRLQNNYHRFVHLINVSSFGCIGNTTCKTISWLYQPWIDVEITAIPSQNAMIQQMESTGRHLENTGASLDLKTSSPPYDSGKTPWFFHSSNNHLPKAFPPIPLKRPWRFWSFCWEPVS